MVVLRDWSELVVVGMVMGVVERGVVLFGRLCLVFGAFLVRRELKGRSYSSCDDRRVGICSSCILHLLY